MCGAATWQVKLQCDCTLTNSIIDFLSLSASRFLGRNSQARTARIIRVTFTQHTWERIRVHFQCLTVADESKTTSIESRMRSLFLYNVKHFLSANTQLIKSSVIDHRRWREQSWGYCRCSDTAGCHIDFTCLRVHVTVWLLSPLFSSRLVYWSPSLCPVCIMLSYGVYLITGKNVSADFNMCEEDGEWFKRQGELTWAWLKFDQPYELQRGNKRSNNRCFHCTRRSQA